MNIHNLQVDSTDIRVSMFSMISTALSASAGIINIPTIMDGIIVAVISTLVGFYGNKGLRKLDEIIKKRKENKGKAV